jgi:hypothetical protein
MAICTEVVPPELTFDGVRVACHLYHAGDDGRPVEAPTVAVIGADVADAGDDVAPAGARAGDAPAAGAA